MVFITLTPTDPDEDVKILWPPSARHLDAREALAKYYRDVL